jgi:hypothetical protein
VQPLAGHVAARPRYVEDEAGSVTG